MQDNLLEDEILQDSASHEKVLQKDSSQDDRVPRMDRSHEVLLDDEPFERDGALYRRPGTIARRLLRFEGEPGRYETKDRICARWDDGMHIYRTNPPTGSAMWIYNAWVPSCFRFKYTIPIQRPTRRRIARQTRTVRRRSVSDPIACEMLAVPPPTKHPIPRATVRRRAFSDPLARKMLNIAASTRDQRWVHVELDSIFSVASSDSKLPGNDRFVYAGRISDPSMRTSENTEEVRRSTLSALWKPRRKSHRKSNNPDDGFQGVATSPVLGDRTKSPAAQPQGTKRTRSSELYHADDEMTVSAKRSKESNPKSTEDNDYPDKMALGSEDHSQRA
ncbi:MAG: hypothetical protein LQ350_006135 [Teloschistes chrysophthalmus]|nr:MAG: hypothetical protein LQ350_006135 [Niorma chrysophthalma]